MYATDTITTFDRTELCVEDEDILSRGQKVLDVLNGAFVVYGDSEVLKLPVEDDAVAVKLSIPKDLTELEWFCRDVRTYVRAGYRFVERAAVKSKILIAMPTLVNIKKLMGTLERTVDVIFKRTDDGQHWTKTRACEDGYNEQY